MILGIGYVRGARGDTPFCRESAPLKIHTPYSASKASYSLRLRSFANQDSLDKRKFSQPECDWRI